MKVMKKELLILSSKIQKKNNEIVTPPPPSLGRVMSFSSIFPVMRSEFQQFPVYNFGLAFKISHVHFNWWQSVDIASTALIFRTY